MNPFDCLSSIPTPPPGAIEQWLVSAAAVASLGLLFAKVWPRRPAPSPTPDFARRQELDLAQRDLEKEIDALRDKIDARFLGLAEKIEQLKCDLLAAGERRSDSLHQRINRLESGLARVDERTKIP